MTDTTGQLYQHMEYFPFGETWVQESNSTQKVPYLFTGKELDEETGLYYFGARYYDPRTSVWQSADPVLGKYLPTGNKEHDSQLLGMGGIYNPANLAMFSYAHLNPVEYVDPNGNAPNQAGATNPSAILSKIIWYESIGMNHSQVLSALSAAHGGNEDRYFQTDEFGWIDVRHFSKSAEVANDTRSNVLVESLGLVNEAAQWMSEWGDDYRSGFSPEDISSNAAGARFGESLDANKRLSEQFESWVKGVGGRDKNDPKANLQALPLTDPSYMGGKNRGSSNLGSVGPGANRELPPPLDITAP